MSSSYYKDIWTKEGADGSEFWKKVRFDVFAYQYQEKVFREYLRNNLSDIKTVLELGAGTGRMTKIAIEELIPKDSVDFVPATERFERYDCIEPFVDINRVKKNLGSEIGKTSWLNLDITNEEFPIWLEGRHYDLIIASEVFMHIKQKDLEYVLLALFGNFDHIINIDWNFDYQKSNWCFIHDYDSLYKKYGGKLVDRKDMPKIQQSLFHYRFGA